MINLCFASAGFVWGLIISIIFFVAIVALGILVILRKRKPVNIELVNDIPNTNQELVLIGSRTYTVGTSNKVKSGSYEIISEEEVNIVLNGEPTTLKKGDSFVCNDGDNIKIDSANNLTLKKKDN